MQNFEADPQFAITDENTLRGLFEETHALAIQKCQDSIGAHAQEFIRRSPFICIGTQDMTGKADVSPRGDPVGFVKILDSRTLAIPDRPGNNRLDTLAKNARTDTTNQPVGKPCRCGIWKTPSNKPAAAENPSSHTT